MGLQGMIGEMVMRCDVDLVGACADDAGADPGPRRGGTGARWRS